MLADELLVDDAVLLCNVSFAWLQSLLGLSKILEKHAWK